MTALDFLRKLSVRSPQIKVDIAEKNGVGHIAISYLGNQILRRDFDESGLPEDYRKQFETLEVQGQETIITLLQFGCEKLNTPF